MTPMSTQERPVAPSLVSVCCAVCKPPIMKYSCRMPQCVPVGAFWHFFLNYSSIEDTHGGMFFNSLPNWSSTLCEGSLFVFQIWSSVFLDLSWLVSLLPIVVFPCVTSPCSHVPDVLFQIHETAQQCLCL